MPYTDAALAQLSRLPPDEALEVIKSLEAKHKDENFLRYWLPYEGDQAEGLKKFTADKKIFIVRGGNRSGKTEEGAAICVAWALGKEYFRNYPAWEWVQNLPIPEPPNNIWIVGLDFATVRDVLWREKLRQGRNHPGFFPKGPEFVSKVNDGDYQAFFTNGSVITCKSADSGREKFQGASVDLIWIDEECESDIFDESYQRTLDCAGKIVVTVTPLKDANSGVRKPWLFDLFEDFQRGQKDVQFVALSFLGNPFVPEVEKQKAKIRWEGHVEGPARLYGDFVRRTGLVYPNWKPAKHILPSRRMPEGGFRVVTIDPAATGTTAALWAWCDVKGNIYLYREYYERDRIISEHARSLLMRNAGDPINLWIIDPKFASQRNGETHKSNGQLYRDNGIPARPAEVDQDYGLNISREYLDATLDDSSPLPKVYIVGDLPNFRHEIEHYTWAIFERGENKGLSKEKPIKRNDHLMNAYQYLCAMRPKARQGNWDKSDSYRDEIKYNSYTHSLSPR